MIQVRRTDYIVGIWMVERINLGKVFIYSLKGENKNEWIGYIKYNYVKQDYNIYMSDNNYRNTFTHKDISESDMMKICSDRINELAILFCHNREKLMIGGDIKKYHELSNKNPWLPGMSLISINVERREQRLKEMRKE